MASRDYVAWRQENNDRVTLVADRKNYRPGDTAEILIPRPSRAKPRRSSPSSAAGCLSTRSCRLTQNSTIYRLPITAAHAPDVFVSVLIIKGVDENNPAPELQDGHRQAQRQPRAAGS